MIVDSVLQFTHGRCCLHRLRRGFPDGAGGRQRYRCQKKSTHKSSLHVIHFSASGYFFHTSLHLLMPTNCSVLRTPTILPNIQNQNFANMLVLFLRFWAIPLFSIILLLILTISSTRSCVLIAALLTPAAPSSTTVVIVLME